MSPLSADGRSVILSHHEKKETKDSWRWNKLTRLRGATDLRSYPDKIWHSKKVKDTTSAAGNGVLRIQLSTLKARRGDELPTFPVEFRDSEDGERIVLSCVELTPQSAATNGNERTCKKAILQRLHSGNGSCERKTLWDIPEQLRCNRKALNRAITALVSEGRIHPVSRSGSSLVTLVQVPLPS